MRKVFEGARLVLCLVLFFVVVDLATQIIYRSSAHQILKYDHANINHMRYSLFNITLWKRQLAQVIITEIKSFKVEESHKETIRKHLESQLDILIDKVTAQIRESNRDSTKGWIRQKMMDMLVDVQAVKKGIPTYAEAIVQQGTSDETQAQLKSIMTAKVSEYMKKTYGMNDTAEQDEIVTRRGAKNVKDARAWLAAAVGPGTKQLFDLTWKFLAFAILLFALSMVHRGPVPTVYFFLGSACLVMLLYVGITTPMIDMDARIPEFGFMLLGHKIQFLDQTVYFQSKSILDVFWIMIQHEKIEMKFVGVLLVLFSVVFPLSKMFFSMLYYHRVFGWHRNGFVRAMALKTGKWSMADVLAVAVLMAYIGVNGMVTTQMNVMKETFPEATFISTNGTTLQIGFYIFIAFVVLSIVLSTLISRFEHHKT